MQIEFGDEDLRRLAEDRDATSRQWDRGVIAAYRMRLQILDGAVAIRDVQALRSLDVKEIDTGGRTDKCYSVRLNEGHRLKFATRLDGRDIIVVVLELVDLSVKGGVR